MTNHWIIVIPPSEGKQAGGEGPKCKPTKPQKEMIRRLQHYDGDWRSLLGVKGKALDEAIAANRAILKSPAMPAIERYTGVVYDGIDYAGMSKKGRVFFDKHVRIVSAVFGLVKPQDMIPNYKLKIEKLDAAKYWKPMIADELRDCFTIDLLPNAHKKAAAYEHGIEVPFYVLKNGEKSAAGHFGKWIKGRFVRWLCENGIRGVKRFSEFAEEGYRWTGDAFVKGQ